MPAKRFFIRLFLIFVTVLSVGQFLVLHHYNSLSDIQKRATTQEIHHIENATFVLSAKEKRMLEHWKQRDVGVTLSPNQQYATYVDTAANGMDTAHVVNLRTGKQVSEATNLYPVQDISWLGNQEIFVGEQESPGNLELNTFYVSSGAQAGQTAAVVPRFSALSPDAAITKVTYSAQTNDVFVLISTGTSSVIYHIGTMENTQLVPFQGGFVKDIAMTQTGDNLYVEEDSGDTWRVVCLRQSSGENPDNVQYDATIQSVETDAALIDVIGNQLYFGQLDGNGLVTAVYRKNGTGTSTLVSQLASPTPADQIAIESSNHVVVNPVATASTTV